MRRQTRRTISGIETFEYSSSTHPFRKQPRTTRGKIRFAVRGCSENQTAKIREEKSRATKAAKHAAKAAIQIDAAALTTLAALLTRSNHCQKRLGAGYYLNCR